MKSKLLASTVLAVSLLAAQAGYSHGDHEHDNPPAISEDAALDAAAKEISSLTTRGQMVDGQKLTESWQKVSPKLSKKGEGYYIVSFDNPEQKKTLYVLMADYGKVYDKNFSGKFEGVN
jgi:hypothetical protein